MKNKWIKVYEGYILKSQVVGYWKNLTGGSREIGLYLAQGTNVLYWKGISVIDLWKVEEDLVKLLGIKKDEE